MERETFNKARHIINDIEALEMAIKTIKREGNPSALNPCLERDRVISVEIMDCTGAQQITFNIDNLDKDIQKNLFVHLLECYEASLRMLNDKLKDF